MAIYQLAESEPYVGEGADPLLASPLPLSDVTMPTSRPGDQSPVWLVPALSVGCAAFIAALLLISQT